jgi:TolB-like protein/DNA-binding winged helix-turn-helix (wHTH) protein/Tfp pilus assembly protein PilF
LIYLFEKFELDEENFRLVQAGRRVPLEPKSLRVLLLLVRAKGRLVSKSSLLEEVWKGTFVDETTLTRAVALVRKQLGDDRREPRFIETVPTMGYRFIAPVVEQTASGTAGAAPDAVGQLGKASSPESDRPAKPPSRRWLLIGTAALALLLAAGALVMTHWRKSQVPRIHSVAVLRLQSLSSDPNAEYFADGMTQELIAELATIPELRIISDGSAMRTKGETNSLPELARKLGADAVVEGTVVRSSDKIRLDIRLVDARSGQQLLWEQFEDSTKDAPSLQQHIAAEIAAHAQVLLTPSQQTRLNRAQPLESAAYDGYLQGRYLMSRRQYDSAVPLFRRAVVLDPGYARAWAGLASGLADLAMGSTNPLDGPAKEAKAAATHAIELDPENGEAWSVLGEIAFKWEWDWKTAERDLQRAIALAPSDSTIELRYATYLSIVGRHDEAVSHMQRALELDPLSFFTVRNMGTVLYWSRRYDESLKYLRRAQEMEPDLMSSTADWVSDDYEMKGMRDEAVLAALENAPSDDPTHLHDRLEAAYHKGGSTAYWNASIKIWQSEYPHVQCTQFEVANRYARIGERDEAIRNLHQALNERCFQMAALNADPMFDWLHSDPRFKDLQKQMNLSE